MLRERATQNALAELGYPAPRVLLAVTDESALGGPFLVMERLPGSVLTKARLINMSRVLVDLQLRLHALPPEPLLRAFDREGVSREVATFDGTLARLEQRVAGASLSGLVPAMRWLREHRRRDEGRPVICHGDFHPLNVLVDRGKVSGVIDWSFALVGPPEYDVGATIALFRQGPLDMPPVIRSVVDRMRTLFVGRYLAGTEMTGT